MSLPFSELHSLVRKFGINSNSFLTLYEGYHYFLSKNTMGPGALPYVETSHAWVGAAEPLAGPEDTEVLLKEFTEAAEAAGKIAMFLPVGKPFKEFACQRGYGAFKVGSEPIFALASYPVSLDHVSTAKRLYARGARISEFFPKQIGTDKLLELEQMVAEWITTRKTGQLGFLNRVEPWTLREEKKYFWTILDGKIIAFLAAVPTPLKKSWYLVDIFRYGNSPPGATELLVGEILPESKYQKMKTIYFT